MGDISYISSSSSLQRDWNQVYHQVRKVEGRIHPASTGALTIYAEKPEISVDITNGSRQSKRKLLGNMGVRARWSTFPAFFGLSGWRAYHLPEVKVSRSFRLVDVFTICQTVRKGFVFSKWQTKTMKLFCKCVLDLLLQFAITHKNRHFFVLLNNNSMKERFFYIQNTLHCCEKINEYFYSF